MKKALLYLSLLILCVAFVFSLSSCNGEDDTCKLALKLSEDGSYYTVTGIGEHTDSAVIIPDEVNGIPVKVIGEKAFNSNATVTSVTIGKNIEEIKTWAFLNCSALTEINWNAINCELCGDRAFQGIGEAVTLNIGKDVETLSSNAFKVESRHQQTSHIVKVNIAKDSALKTIPTYAFFGCTTLTSINLENATKLENIGDETFLNCSRLSEITLPASLKTVGKDAFSGCSGITKVHATSIADWCKIEFSTQASNPASLSSVLYVNSEPISDLVIPEGVTVIGSNTFASNLYLKSVVLPESLIEIGDAFVGCGNITSITLNSVNVFTKEDTPFLGASKLVESAKIKIGKNVVSIPARMFQGITNLTEVDFSEATSLKSIGTYAFGGNKKLESVSLPASLNSMSYDSFEGCDKVYTADGSLRYIGNWLVTTVDKPNIISSVYVKNGTTHIANGAFASCREFVSVSLPATIKVIGDKAFYDCAKLTTVSIHESARIEYIGKEAFKSCTKITTVRSSLECWSGITFATADSNPLYANYIGCKLTIGGSDGAFDFTTDKNVSAFAFLGCQNLASVTINGASEIGESAFNGCTGLNSISIESDAISVGENAFSHCSSLKSIYLNISSCVAKNSIFWASGNGIDLHLGAKCSNLPSNLFLTEKGDYLPKIASLVCDEGMTELNVSFKDIDSLITVSLPEGMTKIGDDAFYGCSGIVAITFPSTLTEIGDNAFSRTRLTGDIVLPNSITIIGKCAFSSTSITSVNIPSSLKRLEASAFSNCSNLQMQVTLPNGIEVIESYVFSDSGVYGTLVIPSSVTTLEQYAFSRTGFARIELNAPIKLLKYTFANCVYLTEVVLCEGVESLENTFFGCELLASASIPSTVTEINGAFSGCKSLESVVLPSALSTIGSGTFFGCAALKSINVPNSVTSIGGSAFRDCSSLASLTIPSTVATIGDHAFEGMTSLKELVIPNSVTSIGEYALSGCASLERLTLPHIKKGIFEGNGQGLFYAFDYQTGMQTAEGNGGVRYCWPTALKEITITSSDICEVALAGSTALQKVTVSCEEISIPTGAFSGCQASTFTLDGKLVSIGARAFQASKLSTLSVKEWAADTISSYAFASTTSLTSFTVPSTVTTIERDAFTFSGLTSLTFESPLDWTVVNSDGEAQPIALLNPTNNATYASSTYGNYTWKKAQ